MCVCVCVCVCKKERGCVCVCCVRARVRVCMESNMRSTGKVTSIRSRTAASRTLHRINQKCVADCGSVSYHLRTTLLGNSSQCCLIG